MQKKIDLLVSYMASKNYHKALKLASSFPRLGAEKIAITKAWAAKSNPDFYRQLGFDIDTTVNLGVIAITEKYNLPTP